MARCRMIFYCRATATTMIICSMSIMVLCPGFVPPIRHVLGFILPTAVRPLKGTTGFARVCLIVGGTTLGDIMSTDNENGNSTVTAGLVTSSGGNLHARFSGKMGDRPFGPLERIALTANGNLQRIFSSYYDAPVKVEVDHQAKLHDFVWDRCVHLTVYDQTFCTAYSTVTVTSEEYAHLVTSGKVGLGQLFRYLDKLPTFHLLDAGRDLRTEDGGGGMWREYTLTSDEITCRIREEFSADAWHIVPKTNEDKHYTDRDCTF